MHVGERKQAVIECCNTEQHVAMGVPGVKAHAARFVLGGTFGNPKRLQRKGEHACKILRSSLVVVVGVTNLESVDAWFKLACVLDADQMAKFVRHHVRKPAVTASNFKIPVGKPQVDGVLAWDCVAVAVEGVVEGRAHTARQIMMITVYDRIVDGFGIGGNFGGVA